MNVEAIFSQASHLINAEDYSEALIVIDKVGTLLVWDGHARRIVEVLNDIMPHLEGDKETAMINRQFGAVYTVLGPVDEAVAYFDKAIIYATKNNQFGLLGDIYIDLGIPYRFKGKFNEAKECFLKALEMYKRTPGEYDDSIAYRQLGRLCVYKGEIEESIRYIKEALRLKESPEEDKVRTGNNKSILSMAYMMKGKQSEARQVAMEALTLLTDSGDRDTIGYVYNTLGLIELYKGDLNKSDEFFRESIRRGIENVQPRNEAIARFNLSIRCVLAGEYSEAKEEISKSLSLFNKQKAAEYATAKKMKNLLTILPKNISAQELYELPEWTSMCNSIGTNPDIINGELLSSL